MATTSRDAKLVLSVESLGQENISKLEKSLRDLAATGDTSAAEFGELADQISRLGDQNDALQSVKALAADTDDLSTKQAQAAATAKTLAANLDVLKTATAEAKGAQDAARAALVAGETEYTSAGNALRALRAEYDAAGKNTGEYRARLQQLTAEQNKANLALVELRENNRQATVAVREANAEQGKAEGAYKRAATQLRSATTAADEHRKALDIAGNAAKKLGVDVDNLGDAELKLLSTFANASNAADRRKQALVEMAEADRLAARETETMAAMLKRGEAALWAEEAALREAARGAQEYAAAKAKAATDGANWQKEADEIVALSLAQQAATRSTQDMVEKLRELAASNAFEKQAAEAQKMLRSAEYARFWADALDEADRKQQALAASTKRVNDAFAQINVRPIEDIQLEIANTNTAMATLAASGRLTGGALAVAMTQGQTKVEALQREMRELTGTMTTADRVAGLLKNSLGQIAAGNIIADGVGYLVNKVKELGAAFITTIADTEKLRRALNAIYKDTGTTASQMEFLRRTAVGAGVAVGDLSAPFIKFAASTKAANISLQVTNELFAAVTRASGTLGLSGEQVGGMLEALSQMASKGVVSMEELRQQLGDRLPGALSLVANGLGLTEAQLIKLVESGQLAARDLFPALTKSLKTMHGEVEGLNVTWQNFKNVLTGVAQDAGDAGWTEILTGALKVLGGTVGIVALGLSSVWEGMRLTGVAAVALAATLKGEGAQAWGYFNEQVDISIDRLTKQNDRLSAMLDPTSDAAKRMREFAGQQAAAAGETRKTSEYVSRFTEKVQGTARSVEIMAEATKIAADAQRGLGARIVGVTAAIGTHVGTLEKATIAAEKEAKAVKIQGDAMVTMSKLRGSAVETLNEEAKATEANLAAAKKAAESQRTLTAVLVEQRNAVAALAEQEESGIEGRKAWFEEHDKKITMSRAELAQSDATVAALTEESAARQQAILVLQDNSKHVEAFRAASVVAEAAAISYKKSLDAGNGSQEEYTRLQRQAAQVTGLYRDALSDLAAKTQAQSQLDQANNAIKQAGLSVQQQAYEQLAAASRATGDLAQATYYEVEAKRIQIQITKAVAEAKLLEVKAARAAIEAEREQLISNGQLTEAKKLELEARLANLKAKEIEAGASATVIKALEAEINAIQRRTTATNGTTAATQGQTSAMDELYMKYRLVADYTEQMIAIQEREIAVTERAAEAYRKKWNIDKDGFTLDSNGQRMQQSVPTERYVYDQATSQGLTPQQALTLVDQYMKNGKPSGWAGASGLLGGSKDWFTVVNEAISKQVMQNNRGAASTPDTTGATTSGSGTQASNPGKTVNINIGGRTTRVNVAGDADANALTSVLRQLENSGGTAA